MASSGIYTLLPLDYYAAYMAIPGWVFNQVDHPGRDYHGVCSDPIYQSGHRVDPSQYIGRDEIAQAIATAEQQIANYLGYWPAPKWICEDEVVWPRPIRGFQVLNPLLKTRWGYFISGGVEAMDMIAPGQPIVYTDEDNDGYLDTGTVTVDGLYAVGLEDRCEVLVVPADHGNSWRIRTLDIDIDDETGTITISGPRWLFVDPDEWRRPQRIPMDDDVYFATHVDVYRLYNDTSKQASIIWRDVGKWEVCEDEACDYIDQNACISVQRHRTGIVSVSPATYNGGKWVPDRYARCVSPTHVKMWYLAGYDDDACLDCSRMGPSLSQAIVRLANVYLPATPCGCDLTEGRWKDDREELQVNSYAVALAQRRLGTTARGAVFAMSVISSLEPLGKGG